MQVNSAQAMNGYNFLKTTEEKCLTQLVTVNMIDGFLFKREKRNPGIVS